MAIILIEEVMMGLGEVKSSLEHAVMVLEDLTGDLAPHLETPLKAVLETTLLQPLQFHTAALGTLLERLETTA